MNCRPGSMNHGISAQQKVLAGVRCNQSNLIPMIVFGLSSAQVAKESITEKCPKCGSTHCVTLYLYKKYLQVFWIPVCPVEKEIIGKCNNCKQIIKPSEMPSYFKVPYETLKLKGRTPFWLYSGIGLIVLVLVSTFLSKQFRKERIAKLILSPKAGQILEIKTQDGNYSVWKIESVHRDSVFFRPHHFEGKDSEVIEILREQADTAYSNKIYSITTKELKKMLDKGDIIDIDR